MNDMEFKKEILSYIENSYDYFASQRKILYGMFKVFHEICLKNGIHYYYGFGSLLGIVRDGGMIPWDADIDVLIPITEIPRLMDVLTRELPDDYYVISDLTDDKYYLCEMRICSKKYDSKIIHIDIFYLIGAPLEKDKILKFQKKVKNMYRLRALRYEEIKSGKNTRDNIIFYIKKIIKLFLKIEPNFLFNKRCNNILWKYDYNKSKYCIVWGEGGECFPINIFEPVQIISNSNGEFLLPQHPEEFLKIRYGNYMSYLPVSERFEEFYRGFKNYSKSTLK